MDCAFPRVYGPRSKIAKMAYMSRSMPLDIVEVAFPKEHLFMQDSGANQGSNSQVIKFKHSLF